jgi:hypothetical protein
MMLTTGTLAVLACGIVACTDVDVSSAGAAQ